MWRCFFEKNNKIPFDTNSTTTCRWPPGPQKGDSAVRPHQPHRHPVWPRPLPALSGVRGPFTTSAGRFSPETPALRMKPRCLPRPDPDARRRHPPLHPGHSRSAPTVPSALRTRLPCCPQGCPQGAEMRTGTPGSEAVPMTQPAEVLRGSGCPNSGPRDARK